MVDIKLTSGAVTIPLTDGDTTILFFSTVSYRSKDKPLRMATGSN